MGGKEPLNGDMMGHHAERKDVGWKGGMVEGGVVKVEGEVRGGRKEKGKAGEKGKWGREDN